MATWAQRRPRQPGMTGSRRCQAAPMECQRHRPAGGDQLARVQTFIFAVPRLKAMLGANALIGHTMRHKLRRPTAKTPTPLRGN